ncbi:hypothetical protein BCF11_0726 [Collimonas sp. PA-H2]|uniref:DUF1269 domain-containing protein n=1 Tax=Collimonas TaxID=202907 RepID=UPI000BF90E7C|nr:MULTISPECIES: DUF1269 domain-containing protein [Collimonas]PFH08372.1 hypothetical protein BCF11_0726 [Collimonas sp. PA-H2]
MLGRQRLYFMLPDVPSARGMLDELLLARVGIRHIHFWAADGKLPADMPEANVLHKTDLANGAEVGLLAGGVIGLLLGMWLVYFPPEWVHLNWLALVALTLAGAVLGSWMSGMAAAALPNSRLKAFHAGIEEGKILLLVDVPFKRVPEIEELLEKRHPEASFAGVEKHIPVFP